MNNFNGLFEIVRGLTLGPVQRLVKTWAAVPPKYKLIWQELYHATYRDNDFQIYRNALSEAVKMKLPAIPCLTILLEGSLLFLLLLLLFVRESDLLDFFSSPDFVNEFEKLGTYLDEQKTKVNFLKFHNIGQLLIAVRQCQDLHTSFKPNDSEIKWLQNSTVVMDLNDITRLSERCEPA